MRSGREALEEAFRLYGSISRSLLEKLETAETKRSGAEGLSDNEKSLIRDVQKSLIIIIEAENRLLSHDEKLAASRDGGLDLEGAREEVRRRLARLSAE